MTHQTSEHQAVPFWRDERYLQIIIQVIIIGAILLFFYSLVNNLRTSLETLGLPFGFDFLRLTAGFDIGESLIEYTRSGSFLKALFVGLLNTLLVSALGIVFATILGVLVGVARLSSNWLVNKLAGIYIEFLRNIPLLVLLVFISTGIFFKLPRVDSAASLGQAVFLSNRGVFIPWGTTSPTWFTYGWILVFGAALSVAIGFWLYRRGQKTGRMPMYGLWSLLTFLAVAILGWFVVGDAPIIFSTPSLQGRSFTGGRAFTPEFLAILTGLSIYTSAFIAEVVRAGIQSVTKGQREAATAIGLSHTQTLRLIVFPQALRVMIPPLTSQYLNLTKNSSLAVAVGYPDLFAIGGTIINQSGRSVEIIIIMMLIYLSFSLLTSLFMNWYNSRISLVER